MGVIFEQASALARRTAASFDGEFARGMDAVFAEARQCALRGTSLASTLKDVDLRGPKGFGRCFTLTMIRSGEAVAFLEQGKMAEAQAALCSAWNQIGVARGLMFAISSIDSSIRAGLERVLREITDPRRARRGVKITHTRSMIEFIISAIRDSVPEIETRTDCVVRLAQKYKKDGRPQHSWASLIEKECDCKSEYARKVLKKQGLWASRNRRVAK